MVSKVEITIFQKDIEQPGMYTEVEHVICSTLEEYEKALKYALEADNAEMKFFEGDRCTLACRTKM
jgi:hypothetical protein